MENIKIFVEQIICVAIITIIIELIIPKGNTKKYLHVILSLFILLNIVSPIVNMIKKVDVKKVANNSINTVSSNIESSKSNAIDKFTSYKNEKIISEVEKELSNDIKKDLGNIGINLTNLKVLLNEDYTFKSIRVTISNLGEEQKNKSEKISNAISEIASKYLLEESDVTIIEEGR